MKTSILLVSFMTLLAACQPMSSSDSQNKNSRQDKVIYGEDNRIDFYKISDSYWFELAGSTAAIIDKDDIEFRQDGNATLLAKPYGETWRLCKDEAFYYQPMVAYCSAFLIGPDIMVTAGHCIRNEYGCELARFVFGFQYDSIGSKATEVLSQNIYQCQEIIHSQVNGITQADYAIIRLDRPVEGHSPLQIQTSSKVDDSAELTVIGYPSGLPGKLAHGGEVRNNENENYFVTNLDTYGGNSGSAVFNSQTRLVEGILVRGEKDFEYDVEKECRHSKRCTNDNCRGEDVVRISLVLDHLSPHDIQPSVSTQQ